jgi:hypothetical protein
MRLDDELRGLAATQHSVIAAFQVRALGASSTELTRLRRSAGWVRLSPTVMAVAGSPKTDRQRIMAGVLESSPGAFASRNTAAALWGLRGFRVDPVDVLRHRGLSRRPAVLARTHEVKTIEASHIKVVDGIPCTSPARTLFDLAADLRFHPHRLERAADWMWNQRLIDGKTLDRTVGELARRGRTGSTCMREVNAARGPDYVAPGSANEARAGSILDDLCLGWFRRQVDVGGHEWNGRVDYKHDDLPLIV